MNNCRTIRQIIKSQPTIEGAGVHLKRAFGNQQAPRLDPFLLLDDFHSDNPDYYLKGFPWHPHRGIETVTYVINGSVEHGDSMGNSGVISSGDVQWMTAGSGIIHQEMPRAGKDKLLHGFQLWANLPAKNKMMNPRYREVNREQIPVVTLDSGVKVTVSKPRSMNMIAVSFSNILSNSSFNSKISQRISTLCFFINYFVKSYMRASLKIGSATHRTLSLSKCP